MKWKWLILVGLCVGVALLTFLIRTGWPALARVTILTLDKADRAGLPANFRMTQGDLPVNIGNLRPSGPSLRGLAALNASGSSQFAEQELASIRAAIGPGPAVTVVDLRQESHGFVNGMAVSWYGRNNEANIGLSKAEVLADETQKLNSLANQKEAIIYRQDGKRGGRPPLKVAAPFKVRSEEQVAQEGGFQYFRAPVTDHHRPTDAAVDDFIRFVRTLPGGAWLHFHCRAGVGRTTTFMMMYDMMRNAKRVTFTDIVQRQLLLGGVNIIRHYDRKNPASPNTRAINEFLRQFYCYCQANRDDYQTSWSQWLEEAISD